MKCPNCKKKVMKGQQMCGYCGAPLENAQAKTAPGQPSRKKAVLITLAVIFVLAVILTLLTIFWPQNPVSAFLINLGSTIFAFVTAPDNRWFMIALAAIVTGIIIFELVLPLILRKGKKKQREEEAELTGRIIVADTTAPAQEVYNRMAARIRDKKAMKDYNVGGKLTISNPENDTATIRFSHSGTDRFRTDLVFQTTEQNTTRVCMEVVEWQERNGVASRASIKGMRSLENIFREVIWDADQYAYVNVYTR